MFAFGDIEVEVPREVFVPTDAATIEAEQVVVELPFGGTLLDLGCGSGVISCYVAKHRPDARVYGVDINPLSVATARDNAEAVGVKATFFCGDLYEPIGDMRFDIITNTLPWEQPGSYPDIEPELLGAFEDHDMVMARSWVGAWEHLKPGGKMFVWTSPGMGGAFALAAIEIEEEFPLDGSSVYRVHLKGSNGG